MSTAIEDILRIIESSPVVAAERFAKWAYAILIQHPPRELATMDEVNRQDAVEEVIIHCVADDCRVLKACKESGAGFTGWFYRVAKNKTLDFIRSKRFRPTADDELEKVANLSGGMPATQEKAHEQMKIVEIVWKRLSELGEKCQMLIRLAAEEYSPQEMTMALGLPDTANRKVSDDLRYCRKKLKELLAKDGISPEGVLC